MLEIGKNDLRDQIATDHEEDIDTNKPTAKRLITGMKKYYRKHSKGSQPVNLSPVFHLFFELFAALVFKQSKIFRIKIGRGRI